MLDRRHVLALALCTWLAACAGEAPVQDRAQTAPTTSSADQVTRMDSNASLKPAPADPADASAGLDTLLTKGTPYADVRSGLIKGGWSPRPDAQCRANVVGGDHESLCAANPELASCRRCAELPELSSSSSDGYSLMRFTGADGRSLELTTYGMLEDALVPGEDSGLALWAWTLEADQTP